MRATFILLALTAVSFTVLIIALTVLALTGDGINILLPGLGLIITLPFLIFLLLIVDAVIIGLTLLARRLSLETND